MINLDTNTRAGRMLAAGRLTLTFRSPTGTHLTVTAKCRAPKDGQSRWASCPEAEAKIIIFEVPSGGATWNDRIGKMTARGFTAEPGADPTRLWCVRQLLRYAAGQPMPDGLEVREEDLCGCCGRALTDPVSIDRGIGPDCYGRKTGSKHETRKQGPQQRLVA